jgi:hypothetical protein
MSDADSTSYASTEQLFDPAPGPDGRDMCKERIRLW